MILNYVTKRESYKDMTSEFVGSYLSDETFFLRAMFVIRDQCLLCQQPL